MYAAPHAKIDFLGDAWGAVEEWQTGLRILGTAVPSDTQLEELDAAFNTFITTNAVSLPSGCRYIGVKWSPIGTDGRYPPAGESRTYFRETPTQGVFGTGYPQIAVVLSLRTARLRGYASNGRMYIPSSLGIEAATGRVTTSAAGQIADAGAALISAINAVGLGNVTVMSEVGGGLNATVTGVRVGRVMDTQRRRRNQLSEEYTEVVPLPS